MLDPSNTDGQTILREIRTESSPLKLSLLWRVRNAWLKVLILVTSHVLGALQALAKIHLGCGVNPAVSS